MNKVFSQQKNLEYEGQNWHFLVQTWEDPLHSSSIYANVYVIASYPCYIGLLHPSWSKWGNLEFLYRQHWSYLILGIFQCPHEGESWNFPPPGIPEIAVRHRSRNHPQYSLRKFHEYDHFSHPDSNITDTSEETRNGENFVTTSPLVHRWGIPIIASWISECPDGV